MNFTQLGNKIAQWSLRVYTLNANMADHSVGARDKLHESEASEASVFCFDSASPEKSCFVDSLVCLLFRYAYKFLSS